MYGLIGGWYFIGIPDLADEMTISRFLDVLMLILVLVLCRVLGRARAPNISNVESSRVKCCNFNKRIDRMLS